MELAIKRPATNIVNSEKNKKLLGTPLLAEPLLFIVDKKLQLAVPYAMQAGTRQGSGWRNEALPVPAMS
ncbi:uncharacterized protein B0T23DRAFT_400700 [Neurospora hispaniola]|uniref:Uncharacterized protein n=1 Tax=Neurospora hispaniola TaxID=588809 RepID=A0AAJ0IF25_9PEZI|nr:hypothetical protein B0T23DRAFT_400700 [Neurospora hispaniola]